MPDPELDEIGPWSEIKLDILRDYVPAYSGILDRQPGLRHIYVDAFAGTGLNRSRETGEIVEGSARIALSVRPPFCEYHLIDLKPDMVDALRELARRYDNVFVYQGDCNPILRRDVLPLCRYEKRCKALVLLDPYGLDLDWRVVEQAGATRSADVFINFPMMDMNRNVLWHDHERVSGRQRRRMDFFWGDDSWRRAAYTTQRTLFGTDEAKADNVSVVEAYCERLRGVAGFGQVSRALPMRNTMGSVVYYLLLASSKPVAMKIITSIFDKYR